MPFRFGTDAVLLAHFARAKKQHRVLDLGTGTGILPLLMTALFHPKHITGIEIQPNMAGYGAAQRCLQRSGLLYRYCNW